MKPCFERLGDALLDARNILLRHDAADDLVLEDVLLVTISQRLDLQPDIAELPVATRLLLVAAFRARLLANCLAVRHTAVLAGDLDAEAALHALGGDGNVRLAHPGDQRLRALRVARDVQRRIFLGHAGERHAHLVEVSLRLGMDGAGVGRRGEVNGLQRLSVFRAERVAGVRLAQARYSGDIAGGGLCRWLLELAAHCLQLAQALVGRGLGVVEVHVGLDCAAVDAEVGEGALLRVHDGLEDEGDRLPIGCGSGALGWAGRVLGERVEQLMQADVLAGRARRAPASSVPAATPALMARRSSVSLISSPSRYLFIRSSSASTAHSTSCSR